MADKILKEAFDKLTALEEGNDLDRDDIVDGIEEFQEIQEGLFEVIERLQDAIRAYAPSRAAYWSSYGLAQLKIVAGSDEYATHDESINNLIKGLKEELQGEGEMEEAIEEELSPRMQARKERDQAKIAQRKSFEEPRKRERGNNRRGTGSFDKSMTQK